MIIRLVHDLLSINAAEQPGKTALICDNRRFTYAELDVLSNRMANAFRAHGLAKGDRVLFHHLNSYELVVGIFAALKANAIFCIIDYANTPETVRHILHDCDPAIVVTSIEQAAFAAETAAERTSLRSVILTGDCAEQDGKKLHPFEAMLGLYPADPIPCDCIDRDLAFLLYTSGSSAAQKGVMVTHRSALASVEGGVDYFGLRVGDIHVTPLPLSFSPGIHQLFQTFRVGGTLLLERSFAFPHSTLKKMAAEHATGLGAIPTILAILLKTDLSKYDLSSLRYVSCVGSALAPALIEQFRRLFPSTRLYSYFGMAEAAYSLGLDPDQLDMRPSSVGKPFPGVEAWLANDEGGRARANETGELVLRGHHVRSGYWNAPEASAERFRPGPLPGELVCHTGDIFRTDEEGYFYFVGRKDEIIKSGAKKIAPREIENVLYGIDGVVEAAAVGVPDPILGMVIKAFVVLNDTARRTLTVQDMMARCKDSLETYKVPATLEIRENLPKTTSGKIKKTELS